MKRSINSLIGFSVTGNDGEIGNVKEFYFDDAAWTIRYLIVNTGKFLFDREVLISSNVIKLQEHYQWSGYLDNGFYTGNAPVSVFEVLSKNADYSSKNKTPDDPHLRRTNLVIGYHVKATDGEIGDVNDMIMNDNKWQLDYLIVDTGRWWPGRRVLISPQWIREISWKYNSVTIMNDMETVKSSLEYLPGQELDDEYLAKLHNSFEAFEAGID